MKKIKIMHLLQSDRFSGAENIVCQIIDLFRDSKIYDMVYVSPNGPIEAVLRKRKIKYYPLKKFTQSEIDKAINLINPDIIHAHDFNASVRASKHKKKKIISHLHNNPLWLSKINIKTVLYSLCANRFKTVIGVSNAILNEFRYKKKIENKFIMIPNIVNPQRVLELGEEPLDEKVDILFVGRMAAPKNPFGALKVLEKLKENYELDFHAVMIGEGPLFEEVKDYIEKSSLKNMINLKGFNDNPYRYMKNSKILFIPSIWEGFGLVAVESMLLGTPVVANAVGGLNDIVDENCGFLCDNEEDLMNSLLILLRDESLREKLGENAEEKGKLFSNIAQYKKKLNNIYESVL